MKDYEVEHRVADGLIPLLRDDLLGAFATIRQSIPLGHLEEALATRRFDAIFTGLHWNRVINDTADHLYALLQRTVMRAARAFLPTMPRAPIMKADPLASVGFRFDLLNPFASTWAEIHGATLLFHLSQSSQQAIRALVIRMFEEGIPPRPAARLLRDSIGLTERQVLAVLRFRATLWRENQLRALARQAASALTAQQRAIYGARAVLAETRIAQLVQRYQDKLLRSRALMIARTESIHAAVAGQQALWERMAADGVLDTARVRRKWLVTPDERLCPVCAPIPSLPGNLVRLDEPFRLPGGGTVLHPPEHPNCRCAVRLVFPDAAGRYPPPDPMPPVQSPPRKSLRPRMPRR